MTWAQGLDPSSSAFSGASARSSVGSGATGTETCARKGCQPHRQQLNQLQHRACLQSLTLHLCVTVFFLGIHSSIFPLSLLSSLPPSVVCMSFSPSPCPPFFLFERRSERKRKDQNLSLIHFSHPCNSHSWARLEPVAQNSVLFFHVNSQGHLLLSRSSLAGSWTTGGGAGTHTTHSVIGVSSSILKCCTQCFFLGLF